MAITAVQAFADIRRVSDMYRPFILTYAEILAAQATITFASPDITGASQRSASQSLAATASSFSGNIRSTLQSVVQIWAPIVKSNATSLNQKLIEIADYFGLNSIEVKSRGTVNNATAAGGGNVGSAALLMCQTNKWDQVVESSSIETLTFTCQAASFNLASLGQETYLIQGDGDANQSEFQNNGVGINVLQGRAYNPGIDTILLNGSFDQSFNGTGTTKVPNWLITAGDANIDRSSEYAQSRGNTAALGCLRFSGDAILHQDLRAQGIQLSRSFPYMMAYRWRRDGTTTGDIIVRLGSTGTGYTDTQSVNAATAGVWQQTNISPDVNDAWLDVFDTDGQPLFQIEVDNFGGGGTWIEIDDVMLLPMALIGGRFLNVVSGLTPSVTNDSYTQQSELTTGAGSVELTGGASGSVDSITVNGVELLRTSIPFNGTLAQTAQDVADEINDPENVTAPQYHAGVATATINIYPFQPATSTLSVVSTTTTITKTDTDVSGGSLGLIQDMLVRNTGFYLPHAASATAGYAD